MEQNGESYPNTLLTGLAYAKALKEEHYGVKSEKLMSLLAETSKQNHGQRSQYHKADGEVFI